MTSIRVAVVQMNSGQDVDRNLAFARRAIEEGAAAGATWVALPENFAYLRREGMPFPCAQTLDDEIVGFLREQARHHRVHVLGGSFPEKSDGDRVYNTSVWVDAEGCVIGVYRKIHLFDVDLSKRGGQPFRESDSIAPGDKPTTVRAPFGRIGLSVCYDLRFPELYRHYAEQGAEFFTVPAAFAPETGRDHWTVLLRARAIENLAFVVAPAQVGQHSETRRSYGRAAVVDPWGIVLAQAGDQPGVILATCDLESQRQARTALPCLTHRRL